MGRAAGFFRPRPLKAFSMTEPPDVHEDLQLLFVYNADSGLVNAARDLVHKTVRPSTYACNLCALTFSGLGMRSKWTRFVEDLGVPVVFLHRDELRDGYSVEDVALPVMLTHDARGTGVLISADEINALGTLPDLMGLVTRRMKGLGQ